jgi:HEAT repeat protein
MTSSALLFDVTLVIVGALVLMGVLTTVAKVARGFEERRLTRLTAELRPQLLSAIYDPDADVVISRGASDIPVIISLVRSLLPALRGEDRDRLVALLEQQRIVDIALRDAYSRWAVRRARAADLLGIAGVERGVSQLRFLLLDRDADVRRTAARALGLVGAADAIPDLLTSLDARRRVPLNTVTMAIIRIGPAGAARLLDGLRRGSPRARAVCAEMLGLQGTMGAVSTLTEALLGDPVLEVRIRAARALGRIGAPSSVDALAEVMRPNEPVPLRAVAARALGNIGGVRPISLLRNAIESEEHIVRQNAAHALAAIGEPARDLLELLGRGRPNRRTIYAREAISAADLATKIATRNGAVA